MCNYMISITCKGTVREYDESNLKITEFKCIPDNEYVITIRENGKEEKYVILLPTNVGETNTYIFKFDDFVKFKLNDNKINIDLRINGHYIFELIETQSGNSKITIDSKIFDVVSITEIA